MIEQIALHAQQSHLAQGLALTKLQKFFCVCSFLTTVVNDALGSLFACFGNRIEVADENIWNTNMYRDQISTLVGGDDKFRRLHPRRNRVCRDILSAQNAEGSHVTHPMIARNFFSDDN